MSRFCGSCGAALNEGAGFCGSCGASVQQAQAPSQPAAVSQGPASSAAAAAQAAPAYQPVAPAGAVAAAPAKGSPWVKILVGLLVLFVACGALAVGVVIYVGHKVSQKAHEYSAQILGQSQAAENAHPDSLASRVAGIEAQAKDAGAENKAYAGDACALLSKEDVGHAIGIAIVSTQKADDGCSYMALGTAADMAAKHAAAMMGAKGADKKTQGMFEQIAGPLMKSMPTNADTQNADGTVPVFNFSIDGNNAEEQLRMNHKALGSLGGSGSGIEEDLDGIGDEAFVEADSMMMVRKGDKLIRIMFMGCPCATDAIKPLAKELAGKL